MLTPGCSLVKVEGWDLKAMRVSTHSTEEQNQKMARAEKYIAAMTRLMGQRRQDLEETTQYLRK